MDKREYNRQYKANLSPEKRAQYNRTRARNRKDWFQSLKTPCVVCGESEPCVIDFHHIDESTKSGNLNRMRIDSKKSVVLEEINKCVTLCANCHRKVHAGIIDLSHHLSEQQ